MGTPSQIDSTLQSAADFLRIPTSAPAAPVTADQREAGRVAAHETLDRYEDELRQARAAYESAELIAPQKPSAVRVSNLTIREVAELLALFQAGDASLPVPAQGKAAARLRQLSDERQQAERYLRETAPPALVSELENLRAAAYPLQRAAAAAGEIVELTARVEKLRAQAADFLKGLGPDPAAIRQNDFDLQAAEAKLDHIVNAANVVARGKAAEPRLVEIQRRIAAIEREMLIP